MTYFCLEHFFKFQIKNFELGTSQCGEINGAKHRIHGCKSLRIIHGDNNDPIFFQNYLGPNRGEVGKGGKCDDDP